MMNVDHIFMYKKKFIPQKKHCNSARVAPTTQAEPMGLFLLDEQVRLWETFAF